MPSIDGIAVEEAPSCHLCGGLGDVLYGGLRDRFFGAPGRWSFLRCTTCSHIWLSPVPLPGQLISLHPSYWQSYDARFHRMTVKLVRGTAESLFERANRASLFTLGYETAVQSVSERLLGRILSFIPFLDEIADGTVMSLRGPAAGNLLDIGCGDGAFLHLMRALGWNVAGVEPDAEAARMARERYGIPVMEAYIEDADLPEEAYDAITLQHVIEHVRYPIQALKTVFSSLKPGGTLVIRTPNTCSWGHRLFHDSWMPLEPPRHLHLFSPRNLGTCVERAGFLVKDLHTSARIAQGVFSASKSIASARDHEHHDRSSWRSILSLAFLITETIMRLVNRDAGEEIVLLAARPLDKE